MKLISLRCPDCNGDIDVKFKGNDFIFCPYCGTQIYVDNEADVKIYTYNISKNVHKEDKAKIAKERRKAIEEICLTLAIIVMFLVVALIFVLIFLDSSGILTK